ASAGAANFAAAIGTLTNVLQVTPGVSTGFITFDQATFAAALSGMSPEMEAAGAATMASAWQSAMSSSVIAPSTVTNLAWTSSNTDVSTPALGSTVLINLAAATASLQSALAGAKSAQDASTIAKAFRDATLMLTPTVTGLVLALPAPPVPLPLTLAVS